MASVSGETQRDITGALGKWIRAKGYTITADGRIRASVAAELIGVSDRTMRRWRESGMGPRQIELGNIWFCVLGEVTRFIADSYIVDKTAIPDNPDKAADGGH